MTYGESVGDEPLRVLVVDDDPDVLLLVEDVLGGRGGMAVTGVTRPTEALQRLGSGRWDVLVADVELPDMTGLELLERAHAGAPDLPCVVITAHASVEYAVGALRSRATEFLDKPIDPDRLLDTVRSAGESYRGRAHVGRRVVVAVGAHPDDVEIGVGGLLSGHHANGDAITIVTLSRGARGGDSAVREEESHAAARRLDARLVLGDLADTRIPVGDPTVRVIQECIAEVEPDIVYTHSTNDVHQDHRAVHQATMVAARGVPMVACYQSPSATVDFHPIRFTTIDEHVEDKLALLACFASQMGMREYLDRDLVVATARYWSRYGVGRFAEPLEIVREAVPPGTRETRPSLAREA
jgi:LmbE family N-acetylglucosaminyl deacetylase/ActR/RegA family two-component response regulator